MASRPLLLFPTPETASRSKLGSGRGRYHKPSYGRQSERLSPVFRQLQTAFDTRRVEVQQTTAGVDPEQVLVIETIGGIEKFANAVRKIDGLEWMGEIASEEITPDEDFYDEDKPEKELTGRLYLVMTNQQALTEMLSLWNRYKSDQNMVFERGLTKFRDVFLCLKDIRRWGVKDRLHETGVMDIWQEDLEHDGDRMIRFETELWYRGLKEKRQESMENVTNLIQSLNGQVISQGIIEEITYHSLLAELPANEVQAIINHPDTELVKCDNIMFFRPVGQMVTGKKPVEGDLVEFEPEDQTLPSGNPVVAVLDGLPLANHSLLSDRLIIDDPDDYASQYTVADSVHGTATTSLVVHGDLSEGAEPLRRPVYVRPIMKPIHWINSPRPEQIPEDVLVVDLIHRAVRRMFVSDDIDEAVAPSVRIINLSIGDPSRQFNQIMSPLARLLDWLSVQYSVLFVISAGNHPEDIDIGISKEDFEELSVNDREAIVVRKLYENVRHRKLLSPAESINGITVGALHNDNASVTLSDHVLDLYNNVLPSPISSFGSGYRRSVKPDVIYPGGRVIYEKPIGVTSSANLKLMNFRTAPGNKVASPSSKAGDLNKIAFCRGTSNSAALVSRAASICYDSLVEIFEDQAPDIIYQPYTVPLLKAMIVHGCSWGEIGSRLNTILQTENNGRQLKNWISQWLGYGVPDSNKVLNCTEQRASLLGFGQLNDEEAHIFNLPLPPSMSARREQRRLTVTLAWLSPIVASTQRYRAASLWFEIVGGALTPTRQDAEWQAVKRGTVQHEVFEGNQAIPLNDGDSLTIKVNCRKDAGKIQNAVEYGLAVSLEVAEGIDIAIYDEIRARIAPAVEIRARGEK